MPRKGKKQQIALRVNGAGAITSRPFGGNATPSSLSLRGAERFWDATHPSHLALPRSTGPYQVVRTTKLFKSPAEYIQFGPSVNKDGMWNATCAIASVDATQPINGVGNTYMWDMPFPGNSLTNAALTAVPSAMTVQILNPQPLQRYAIL